MEQITTLILGLAWPITTLWIVYLFRSELRSLIHRLSQFKYKDLEAKFESDLTEAEVQVGVIERTSSQNIRQNPEVISRLDHLRLISDVSPRAAIMEAWALIEEAAGKSGFVQGASVPRVNTKLFVAELQHLGKLPAGSETLFEQMRQIRNQAAHFTNFEITKQEADRYLQLAAKVSELIFSVSSSSQ